MRPEIADGVNPADSPGKARQCMILIIDNYDSFTYNLVHRLGEIGMSDPSLRHEIIVIRNDEIDADQLVARQPTYLIISPGPRTPREGGISCEAVRGCAGRIPVLGVCLGHQCIGHAFGATIDRAPRILHGKTSDIRHDARGIFAGLPDPFVAARYHSLAIRRETLPDVFEVSAWTDADEIMAVRHRECRLDGVQFHPESFLTPDGTQLLANFLRQASPVAAD